VRRATCSIPGRACFAGARVAASVFLTILTSSVVAFPGAGPGSVRGGVVMNTASTRVGRSVGSPTAGHLVGGAHLEDTGYLRIVPTYASGDVRWGLAPLVGMLDRAARTVRHQYPDAVLSVGHLSRSGGGEVDRHRSHESGRDADVAFYVKNHVGKPVLGDHFVAFRGDGTSPSWPGAVFDDARNWALVAALLNDPAAHVSRIFVAAPLRARLLAYAERMGVPQGLRVRAAEAMLQPHGSLPHDDHFHVRISCPGGMRECIENPEPRRFARVPSRHARPRAAAPSAPAVPATRIPHVEQTLDRQRDERDKRDPSFDPAAPSEPAAPPPSAPALIGAPLDLDDADGDP